MPTWLVGLVLVEAASLAAFAAALVVADRAPSAGLIAVALGVELTLVTQAAVAGAGLLVSEREVGTSFLPYLAASLVAVPAGILWAMTERTRAGTAVVFVAAAALAIVELRLGEIWRMST